MRHSRRAFLASMLTSVATPAVMRLARADAPQVALKLHHAFSAVSAVHEKFLVPWARKVEADCGNRIRIDLFPSMQLGGAPAQLFDQARDGFADIVWAAPGAARGRFARNETFELPFVLSHRALVNSKALCDFAAANLQDEFHEFHPLCFSCRDHGVLHTARAIKSIDDLTGLRLHVPSRLAGEAVRALGAQGVSVPTPQVPMALSTHVIDGCLDPWDAMPGLRLGDGVRQHTDFAEQALSSTNFVLAMNRQAYERLPREARTVIDDNSGQPAASMAGAMWDLEAGTVAAAARDRGEPIAVIGGAELARWRKATEPVIASWQKEMRERGLDGGKLLADLRSLLAKYADEPEPQAPQAARRPQQPSEQKAAAEPPPSESTQPKPVGKPEAVTKPEAVAKPEAMPTHEAVTRPEAVARPVPPPPAKPGPAPVAAPKFDPADIPL
jgi:TRAP-type transport system periplasmic protein